ncbi:MAG: sensor histidine kinase [Oscillatoriales cyanobacterium]|nr:MAG: sensor histidine kinase [Oscillatoriales cyanobacterium]
MSVNLTAIDLDKIDDPILRQQIEATIAEHRDLQRHYLLARREAQFKSHFLARISHELRSPLSGIIGSHQLVLEDLCEDTEEEHDFIKEANRAALKLVHMLDSLLLVSRIEAGRRPPKIQPLSLHQLLQRVCEPIQLEAANGSVSFTLNLAEPEVTIATDKDLMISILIDLLELAIDAGRRRDAQVQLTCQTQADRVEFCLDSALASDDFSDPIDFLDRHIASQREDAKQPLPDFELSPSLRLLLNQLLIELLGGGIDLPIILNPEQPTISRLRFWLPRSV